MLTQEQVEQFERDGFLAGGKVIDDERVGELRDELERVIADHTRSDVPQPVRVANLSKDDARPIWQVVNIWQASEAFRRLMLEPKIIEECAQLTGAHELRVW